MLLQIDVLQILSPVVLALVDAPEQVVISLDENRTINIVAAPEDLPKLIGANGKTARSLRTLLSGMCVPRGLSYSLNIDDSAYRVRGSPLRASRAPIVSREERLYLSQ